MKKSLPQPTSVMDMGAVSSEDCVLTMDCCFQDQQTIIGIIVVMFAFAWCKQHM